MQKELIEFVCPKCGEKLIVNSKFKPCRCNNELTVNYGKFSGITFFNFYDRVNLSEKDGHFYDIFFKFYLKEVINKIQIGKITKNEEKEKAEQNSDYLLNSVPLPKEFWKNKLVLDAGCGGGWATLAALNLNATIISIDNANTCIEFNNWILRNSNGLAIKSSMDFIPIKEETFDIVMAWSSIHHTKNPKKTLKTLVKLLKKDGTIMFSVYGRNNFLREFLISLTRSFLRLFSLKNRIKFSKLFIIKNNKIRKKLNKIFPFQKNMLASTDIFCPVYRYTFEKKEIIDFLKKNNMKEIKTWGVKPCPEVNEKIHFFMAKK